MKLAAVSPERKRLGAFLALFLGLFSIIALLDYSPLSIHESPSDQSSPILGQVGVITARTLLGWLGLSAWLVPWFFLNLSLCFYKKIFGKPIFFNNITVLFAIFSICILSNVKDNSNLSSGGGPMFDSNTYEHGAGGSIGAYFYSGLPFFDPSHHGMLKIWFGPVGTSLVSIILLISCLYYQFRWYFKVDQPIGTLLSNLNKVLPEKSSNKTFGNSETQGEEVSGNNDIDLQTPKKSLFSFLTNKGDADVLFEDVSLKQQDDPKSLENKSTSKQKTKLSESISPSDKEQENVESKDSVSDIYSSEPEEKDEQTFEKEEIEEEECSLSEGKVEMDGFKVVRAAKTEKASDLFPERKGDYHFPTLDLLMEPPEEESNEDEDHMIKARNLKETLAQFKVEIELGEVHTGPVITRYDVHPAAGVRVEKIANLDKNLAMALKADSVRILAPVPGKGCVGIEVPNQNPAPVCLKEILQSKAWASSGAEIPIVLGKEASGRALVADLTKMPHLLVAGSTGSGKTVCINAIIASLCYHSSPEDVRFIMVDPKIVEMKVYNDLPHMLIPVVTEPKKVPGALKWLLVEMERRYQIFSKVGVRNIAGFNAKILKDKEEKEKAQLLDAEMTAEERAALSSIEVPRDDEVLEIPENKLPYIVCIIDELADLMMVAQADVETGIARLAQLARAAGIHLIIATQRPSVNVITGVIKANLPSRISFRVASYRDSQTILDGKGAEALIGKGDMLFIPPGSSTFLRAQGAFVSDDEINGIVDYLKINGPPQIIEEVRDQIESAGEGDVLGDDGANADEDPMVRKAIEVIRTTKRASTSNLQRKLSIGYNRAARIMDDLEDRGLVGPDVPGQGREILMDL